MTNFIIKCKKELIAHLDKSFLNFNNLSDISVLAERVQTEAQRYSKHIICQNAYRLFQGFSPHHKFANYIIDANGYRYNVNFAPNLYDFSELGIAILRQEGKTTSKRLFSQDINIRGYGRYKTIHLEVSSYLKLNGIVLPNLLTVLFETAYEWFGFKIEEFVERQTVSVAATVYKYIRKILYNDNIYKAFWLAVVGKGYGFRLVNVEQVSQLFRTFYEHDSFDVSVNSSVSNLITTRLPYDELLMKAALDYNEKIDGDISQAKYTQKGDVYSKTMYSLYNGNAFSIYPLLRGEIGVVALYPVEYKETIEDALDDAKDDIVDLLKRELCNIELAYLLFDDNYQNDFEEGIPSICRYEDYTQIDNLEVLYAVLERYYAVYERFGLGFILDNGGHYPPDEMQIRLILERNGMLTKSKTGFCISQEGIELIQQKERNGVSMNLSNNSGIINIVGGDMENVQNQNNASPTGMPSGEVMQLICSIRETCKDSEEYEYVKNLTNLLEQEIKAGQKKPNMLKAIISGLSTVSSITTIVTKIAALLGISI